MLGNLNEQKLWFDVMINPSIVIEHNMTQFNEIGWNETIGFGDEGWKANQGVIF